MAKINPIKTRQEAEKAEKAGKLDLAIPLYRQLLEDNPRDWNTINKIGDLLAKIGKMREAGDEYAKVADFYERDGFHLKAIAIWKKINKLDATVVEPYAKLADLYSKQGLVMEAKGQYQVVAEDQLKRGRLKEAAETLRRMVEIDSSDLKTRSRLADIYTKEGSTAKAVAEYIAISDELNLKGHPAEAIQVLEKGLKIDAGITVKAQLGRIHLGQKSFDKAIAYLEEVTAQDPSPSTLMQLGQAYLGAKRVTDAQTTLESVLEKSPQSQEARVVLVQIYAIRSRPDEAYDMVIPLVEQLLLKRDTERSANLLGQITRVSPHHVRTLQKLVEVARIGQNDRAVVQALSNLLEAHVALGSDRAAEDTAAQLVEVEPENEQFRTRLEALRKKKAAPVLSGPALVAAALKADPDMTLPPPPVAAGTSDFDGLEFDTGAIVRPKGISANSSTDREFIEEHLAESRVFRKYGLLDKAEEQVDLVLVRYPNIFDGRFEKKEIFKETERIEEAAKECVWLADVAAKDGNESLAKMLNDEAQALWPGVRGAEAAEEPVPAAESSSPLGEPEPVAPALASDTAPGPPVLDLEVSAPPLDLGPSPEAGGFFPDAFSEEPPSPFEDLPDGAPADASAPDPFAEVAPVSESGIPPIEDDEEDLNFNLDVEDEGPADSEIGDLGSQSSPLDSLESDLLGFEDLPGPASDSVPDALPDGFGELGDAAHSAAPEETPFPELPEDTGPDLDFAGMSAGGKEPAPVPTSDPEIARAAEEVDSYVALGFLEDAKDALREAIARFPGDPSLIERASSLGLDLRLQADPAPKAEGGSPPRLELPEPEPRPPSAENDLLGGFSFDDLPAPTPEPAATPAAVNLRVAAAPLADGGIDLGAELSALFDAQPAVDEAPVDSSYSSGLEDQGLRDVFDAFKKGVDSQLGEGDYDTRYNLGIAYKEMGLIDEAIAEFQLAAKDLKRSLECSSMIGICFMEKGMADVAIQWYERGLQVPGRVPEEYRGLRYDLGLAFEATGDFAQARTTFENLVREDPSFRDASEKLRELQSR